MTATPVALVSDTNANGPEHHKLTTCIVGGGSSAHVLIPFLAEAGHTVNLLTRRPKDWEEIVFCEITDATTGAVSHTFAGFLNHTSSDPAEVIPEADIVILCMPVHQYRPALDRIAPHLNRNKAVFVGTIYGQAGFNWMVHSIEREHDLTNLVTFAIGEIPWICRTLEYGQSCRNYGGKQVNTVAVAPADKFATLERLFLNDISLRPLKMGKFEQADSFLELTMSVDNQIIHPARCYGLWTSSSNGEWDADKVPYFYRDFDEESAENLRRLDDEYTLIRNALKKRFPDHSFKYMLSYAELESLNHTTSSHADILNSLRDSPQLAAIRTPTVESQNGKQILNTECRFFTDDIPYGLLIAKWMAQKLGVATPFLDCVISWAQSLRDEYFLGPDGSINLDFCLSCKYKTGIPESYGLSQLQDVIS